MQLLQNNWVSKTVQFRGFLSANAPSRAGPPPCARRAWTPLVHQGLRGGSQRGCGTPRAVVGVEVAEGERACTGGAGTVPFVLGVAAGPTRAGSVWWGPTRGHWGPGAGHRPEFLRLGPRPCTACFIPWLRSSPTAGWERTCSQRAC